MDFIRFFQRITEKTVRYEASFFGRGMLHSLGVSLDQEITYNLPLSYRTGIRTVAGGVKSPPLTFWFASGKPLLLKAPSELRSAWEENFVAHGYRNMAIHGYTDVEIGTISVFGIYNYFVESGVDLRGLLESVAIATHSALHELPKTYEREFHAVDGKGVSRLTRREEEIIHWVSRGKTNADIALILGISSNTVRNHLHNASEKLSASNRMELVSRVGQNFSRQ
jgi:DNA-binding CsgD family transcriptional regulator